MTSGSVPTVRAREADVAQQNFIGGAWVAAADGATDEVLNPATGEVLAEVASGGAADADAAVAAALGAFETWGLTTPRERSEKLLALAAAVEGDLDELKALEMANVGKPVSIIEFEFDLLVDNLRFFAGAARTLQTQAAGEYLEDHTSMLRRDPLGVAVGIAPWNYPLNMAVWKMGPALAAGNTFILKPSELTPLTALRVAELAADIFPPGVFNVVTGQGETAGRRPGAPPGCGHRVDHRRRGHRQAHRPQRGRHAQAGAPRAGWQGPGGGLRRRGHRPRGVHPGRHGLLQLGPGLHGAVSGHRRSVGLRRAWSASWATPWPASRWAIPPTPRPRSVR